jgi:hypothetical protein
MEKTTAASLLRRKKSTARITVSALLSFLLFVAAAPFAHAAVKFNLLQGEERVIDMEDIAVLFGANSFVTAQFQSDALEIQSDLAGGFILIAKQPTQQNQQQDSAVPVTLVLNGNNGDTVTKDVYVQIYENHAPKIDDYYKNRPFLGRGGLLPGIPFAGFQSENFVDIRVFDDEDLYFFDEIPPIECTSPDSCQSSGNVQAETLTYVVEGLPSFIHYDIVDLVEIEAIVFYADEDAVPGVYAAKVYAVDMLGQQSEPVYIHLHVREFAPRDTVTASHLSLEDSVHFDDLTYAFQDVISYEYISYFEFDHPYGEAVQVCGYDDHEDYTCLPGDKLEWNQELRFAEPGVYELSIAAVVEFYVEYEGQQVVKTIKSKPILARFYVDEFSALNYESLYAWPFLSVNQHSVFSPEPGTLYIVPYQGEDIATEEQLEQWYELYANDGAVKAEFVEGYQYVESNDLQSIKNNIGDRVSFYVVDQDGTIRYKKHFVLVEDTNVTVKEIADYYKHPLYPSAEIMPETLLNRISPVSDGGY